MNLFHSTTERGSGVFTTKAYILQKHQYPLNANLEQQYGIWVLKNSIRERVQKMKRLKLQTATLLKRKTSTKGHLCVFLVKRIRENVLVNHR